LSEAKSGTASPHFAEPVLGLAEGETRGLNAGYEAMATGVIRDTASLPFISCGYWTARVRRP